MTRAGRSRKLLLVVIIAIVIVGALIAVLPAIASATVAPGIVRGLVEKQINGTATVEKVTLRWAGPHVIEGLVIHDASGATVSNLDVHLKTTFLALALSRMVEYDVTIEGSLSGTLRENRTLSFTELLRAGDTKQPADDAKPTPGDDAPPRLDAFTPIHITLLDVEVRLDDQLRQQPMTVTIESGEITAALGQPISVSISGTAVRGDTTGSFTVGTSIEGLLRNDGSITPEGASVQIKLAGDSLPLPGTTQIEQLQSLNLALMADDLAQHLDVSGHADLTLADFDGAHQSDRLNAASTVIIDATILRPVNDRLQPDIGPASVMGTIDARRIPADLVQLVLANVLPDSPVDAMRDLGPSIDVQAQAHSGSDQRTLVAIELRAARASMNVSAEIDTPSDAGDLAEAAVDVTSFDAQLTAQPELVAALTESKYTIDRPTPVKLSSSAMRLPAAESGKDRALAALAGNITVLLEEPFTLRLADRDTAWEVGGAQLSASTQRLDDQLIVFGRAMLNGGELSIDERIGGLIADDGSLQRDWRRYEPIGRISLTRLPGSTITAMLDDVQQPLLDQLDGFIDASLTTSATDAGELRAVLDVQSNHLAAGAQASRTADCIRIDSAQLSATIEPELAAALQQDREHQIKPDSALPATLSLVEPVELPFDETGGVLMPDGTVLVSINTDPTVRLVNVPALVEPLELRDTSINLIAHLDAGAPRSLDIVASALWHTQTTDRTVGDLMLEATIPIGATSDAADATLQEIRVSLERLAVRRLERAIGREVDSLAKWIGSRGNLHLTVRPGRDTGAAAGSFEAQFTQLAGEFDFELSAQQVMSITGRTSELTIAAAALNEWLRMSPDEGSRITSNVPGSLDVATLRFPLALLDGEPIDPQDVEAEIDISAGPLAIEDAQGTATSLTGITSSLTLPTLSKPLHVTLSGAIPGAGEHASGEVDADARISNLLDAERRFSPGGATVNLAVTGDALPVAVADSLGAYDGLLVAAVGSTAQANITANDFSSDSGTLDAELRTDQGQLSAHLLGRDGFLHIEQTSPLRAELEMTPEFRDRVLQPIHPLFADIRSVEQPIRAVITMASVPVNGDVSRLDADIEMTVGAIELESGSALLAGLDLFRQAAKTVPGRIEPIRATIRSGVVTYERFAVVIGKYTLTFHGGVDLSTRAVDLRFDVPGTALTRTFHELEGYLDQMVIPFRTHGVIGDVKTEIAPDYNLAEDAARAGFRGAIEKELGGAIGDLLSDLLKPKGKKEDPEPDDGGQR